MKYVKILGMERASGRPPRRGGAYPAGTALEGLRYDGESLPLEACRLLAPCEATKLVCVGKNYYDHIEEMKSMLDASHNPDKPTLF